MSKNEVISETKEVVKTVYADLLQPSVKEVGTVVKSIVKIALMPVKALVGGIEKFEEFVVNSLSRKLKNIPKEEIKPPEPDIAVKAVNALMYTGNKPKLQELFLNLLANSMYTKNETVHPAFVNIIDQMTTLEASICFGFFKRLPTRTIPIIDLRKVVIKTKLEKMENQFYVSNPTQKCINSVGYTVHKNIPFSDDVANCDLNKVSVAIENLRRLNIVETIHTHGTSNKEIYMKILESEYCKKLIKDMNDNIGKDEIITYLKKYINVSDFGMDFLNCCCCWE